MHTSPDFWNALETLIQQNGITIDRPKDTPHPRFPQRIYPLDYGYINQTSSTDNAEIDVWRGSLPSQRVTGILCCVDMQKQDIEIKVCISCSMPEMQTVQQFNNVGDQHSILIPRDASET